MCDILSLKDVFDMTIGQRINKRRLDLGLSADDVAEKLGVNRATVYRYESNYIKKLPTTALEKLAEILQTSPAYLMGWISEEVSTKNNTIAKIVTELRSDDMFLSIVENVYNMDKQQRSTINQMLSAFDIKGE